MLVPVRTGPKVTAMTTTTHPIDEAERARRSEFIRDQKAALANNETFEARTKRREQKADDWSGWFRHRMDAADIVDPAQLLPDAFARLELLAEDRIVAAMKELKAVLRKAVS